jgi:hypothetical protein
VTRVDVLSEAAELALKVWDGHPPILLHDEL